MTTKIWVLYVDSQDGIAKMIAAYSDYVKLRESEHIRGWRLIDEAEGELVWTKNNCDFLTAKHMDLL